MATLREAEGWSRVVALVIAALVLLPLVTLLGLAVANAGGIYEGSVRHVLPYALRDTLLLSAGVMAMTMVMGTTIAAVTTFADFPGRRVMTWMAVLPVSLPAYLLSYIMVEIDRAGTLARSPSIFDQVWRLAALAMPDPRSMPGAIAIFSLVLYPYVYVAARIAFAVQGVTLFNAARTLGRPPLSAFAAVSLPLASSSILAGAMLAVMETLNDIGASEYLGVRTLAFTIYTTWLNRDDLAGAAQLSVGLVLIVLALAFLMHRLSRTSSKTSPLRGSHKPETIMLTRYQAAVAVVAGFLPIVMGFGVPMLFLVEQAWRGGVPKDAAAGLWHAVIGSLSVSAAAALLTVVLAGLILLPRRLKPGRLPDATVRLAGYGYALPGAVLALAIFIPAGGFDNQLDRLMRDTFGIGTGLLLSGSLALVVYGYTVRFLSIAQGVLQSGFDRVPQALDMAARTLGRTALQVFAMIPLRLNLAAMVSALLLVFVDGIKELPLTLILRPLGFETLATSIYDNASRGEFEKGAVQALVMVAFGMAAAFVGFRMTENRKSDQPGL